MMMLEDAVFLPDQSFICRRDCAPRLWPLFANEQWIRIFERGGHGLKLIKAFNRPHLRSASAIESISLRNTASAWLDEAVWNDEFDHLILAAPENVLEEIRSVLSPPVLARMIRAIDWPATEK